LYLFSKLFKICRLGGGSPSSKIQKQAAFDRIPVSLFRKAFLKRLKGVIPIWHVLERYFRFDPGVIRSIGTQHKYTSTCFCVAAPNQGRSIPCASAQLVRQAQKTTSTVDNFRQKDDETTTTSSTANTRFWKENALLLLFLLGPHCNDCSSSSCRCIDIHVNNINNNTQEE
jgi:hypothetical protein